MKFYYFCSREIEREFYCIDIENSDPIYVACKILLIKSSGGNSNLTVGSTFVRYKPIFNRIFSKVTDPDMINKLNKIMIFE